MTGLSPLRLFAYGTLQLPDVLHALVGQRWLGEPALLRGYARYQVAGKPYPAIVTAPTASVPGTLYSQLGQAELERLDHYEGELYERCELRVEAAGGAQVAAFSYVLRESYRSLLSGEDWDLAAFEQQHLARYLERIAGTRRAP